MQKLIPILLILFAFAVVGCKGDVTPKNTAPEDSGTKTDETKNEGKDGETKESAKNKLPKIAATPEEIEKLVGKSGKFKLMYYHQGECYTCQGIIAQFEMILTENAEDFEFRHFLSYEIEANGVNLTDFGIDEMTAPTGYLFDKENKLVWMQPDPEFKDFINALKNVGMKKEIVEPVLPPDFFDQPH